jgi:predicted  nucleic acid-binding Zn-ribbon protein
MSQPFKLFRLQQIDSQIDQGRLRLSEIEHALQDKAILQRAQQEAREAEANLSAARKALRRAEDNVQAQRVKIEQTEAILYGGKVHNPKELQDLQNEAAALKRYLVTLEDRLLEAMIALEEAEARYTATIQALAEVTQQDERLTKELLDEKDKLLQEIGRLESERQAACTSIPVDDLHLYNELRQKRRGVAVARVLDRTCSACGSTLNAALLQAARSPNQITRCDSCGRILYAG